MERVNQHSADSSQGLKSRGSSVDKPELLAPAGTMECLRTALDYGADAVYAAGQSFGLRAAAPNFSMAQLREATAIAHSAEKRLYIAVNALIHESELSDLRSYLLELEEIQPDGIIFSDAAVAELHRELNLSIPMHLSTQSSTMNSLACSFWAAAGVSRIVLAREATLQEIERIRSCVPDLELEVFVHGAMCIAHSGRCLLSSVMAGRSGNAGACAQPCRWEYELREKDSNAPWMSAYEDSSGTYIMNSRDLMMLDHIPELVMSGVNSLKIEGRMKSAYYVASVVSAYRQALDLFFETGERAPRELLEELQKSATRTYTRGFFFGPPGASGQDTIRKATPRRYTFAARVIEDAGDGYAWVEQRNKFCVGDLLEVLSPFTDAAAFTVEEIRSEDGELRQSAPHAQERLLLKCPLNLMGGELLRRPDAEPSNGEENK